MPRVLHCDVTNTLTHAFCVKVNMLPKYSFEWIETNLRVPIAFKNKRYISLPFRIYLMLTECIQKA